MRLEAKQPMAGNSFEWLSGFQGRATGHADGSEG